MPMLESMTEREPVVDLLVPIANAAGTVTSLGVDMSKFKRVRYLINLGAVTGAGTLDANLQSAALSNFAVPHNVTNSNLTQVTNAVNGPNTIVSLEARADQIQQQNQGDRYVRLRVVIGTNTVLFGAIGLGGDPAQLPGSQYVLNANYVGQQLIVNT